MQPALVLQGRQLPFGVCGGGGAGSCLNLSFVETKSTPLCQPGTCIYGLFCVREVEGPSVISCFHTYGGVAGDEGAPCFIHSFMFHLKQKLI
jgi:hypothetical protein